jgi:hypothetical protein
VGGAIQMISVHFAPASEEYGSFRRSFVVSTR